MSKCPNCGTTMSCGCQKRTLANGKPGCSKCISPTATTAKSATRYTNLKNDSDNVNPEINSASLSKKQA